MSLFPAREEGKAAKSRTPHSQRWACPIPRARPSSAAGSGGLPGVQRSLDWGPAAVTRSRRTEGVKPTHVCHVLARPKCLNRGSWERSGVFSQLPRHCLCFCWQALNFFVKRY